MLIEPKHTMLLVDDDRSILRVLKKILEKHGYSVVTAETGKEAAEKLQSGCFDASLLDLRLPDMNGTELVLRMMEVAPDMVKIMMTGVPDSLNKVEMSSSGVDFLLVKPVQPEVILEILKKTIEGKVLKKPLVS